MNSQIEAAADAVAAKSKDRDRTIIAVAGPPGAGKSTFAESLVQELKTRGIAAATIPMDGFHYDNAVLDARGWRDRKGAPHTFDAAGLLSLLRRLRDGEDDVAVPLFDRGRDIAIAGARLVVRDDRVLIAEGNYLLLDTPPWAAMRPLFDLTILLDPGMPTIRQRLIARWLDHGHTTSEAERRAAHNDIPNAEHVLEHSAKADLTFANGNS